MNNVTLLPGDCLDHLRALPTNSVDSVVTDPPYELGFMGRAWDATGIAYQVALWREIARVLKPGGHVVAFGGTRTHHRMACAIEDAGFEIRDSLHWLYGSGFPKSKNVGNGIGTALKPSHEPIVLARKPLAGTVAATVATWGTGGINIDACRVGTGTDRSTGGLRQAHHDSAASSYALGQQHTRPDGGRWPPNVLLTHSAACRPVGTRQVRGANWRDSDNDRDRPSGYSGGLNPGYGAHYAAPDGTETVPAWACAPDCPVAALDRQSGTLHSGERKPSRRPDAQRGSWGMSTNGNTASAGGASRFFPVLPWDPATDVPFAYVPKASRRERNAGCAGLPERQGTLQGEFQDNRPHTREGYEYHRAPMSNHHPTVKPVALMRWLVRLVTPPGGTVLDPFLGSGTTGIAALHEGYSFIGCEQDADYLAIAAARIAAVDPLFQEVAS